MSSQQRVVDISIHFELINSLNMMDKKNQQCQAKRRKSSLFSILTFLESASIILFRSLLSFSFSHFLSPLFSIVFRSKISIAEMNRTEFK